MAVGLGAVGTAAAQEVDVSVGEDEDAQTNTTAENSQQNSNEDEDRKVTTVTRQINGDLRVTRQVWNESSGDLTVTIENTGNMSADVYIVQVIESGGESWAFRNPSVGAGETIEITLPNIPDKDGEPAVLVAAEDGMEDGELVWLTTGSKPRPETSRTLPSVLLGLCIMTAGTVGMAWHRYHRIGNGPQPLEEELK